MAFIAKKVSKNEANFSKTFPIVNIFWGNIHIVHCLRRMYLDDTYMCCVPPHPSSCLHLCCAETKTLIAMFFNFYTQLIDIVIT